MTSTDDPYQVKGEIDNGSCPQNGLKVTTSRRCKPLPFWCIMIEKHKKTIEGNSNHLFLDS